MAAKIDYIIPEDNFERVRDAIAAILLTELGNQKLLQPFDEDILIYRERMRPITGDEKIYLNILLDSATYDSKTAQDMQGRVIYFVDFHTTGQYDQINNNTGDLDSAIRLHKFMSMTRHILSSDLYRTLGFSPGFIGGKYVESFATAEPIKGDDSNYTRMGRISFAVRILETMNLATPVLLGGNDTTVKIELTEHGYQYVFDNAA